MSTNQEMPPRDRRDSFTFGFVVALLVAGAGTLPFFVLDAPFQVIAGMGIIQLAWLVPLVAWTWHKGWKRLGAGFATGGAIVALANGGCWFLPRLPFR